MSRTGKQRHHPGLIGLLASADARASNAIYLWGTRYPRWIWKLLEYTGDGFVWLAVCVALFLWPLVELQYRTLALNLLAGWVVDLLLVGSLKALVRRSRPVYNQVQDFVVVVAVDKHSFPSGHAARYADGSRLLAISRSLARDNNMNHIGPVGINCYGSYSFAPPAEYLSSCSLLSQPLASMLSDSAPLLLFGVSQLLFQEPPWAGTIYLTFWLDLLLG